METERSRHRATSRLYPFNQFMGFYGLVFPAYVLLKIFPRRQLGMTRFWSAIILAAPFYELGFIERQTIWLLPGVVIVLIAWMAAPIRPDSSRQEHC